MTNIQLGIDEAGRGAATGSLVMAGVLIYPGQEKVLELMHIQDSKKYKDSSPREFDSRKIKQHFGYGILSADSKEIDASVRKHELNVLERRLVQTMVNALFFEGHKIDEVYLDGHNLFDPLIGQLGNIKVIVEDHAESKFPCVAAASVIAKVERDRLTRELMGKAFDKGSGYCNEYTLKWLREQYKALKILKMSDREIFEKCQVRMSWSWFLKHKQEIIQ
jgi:ribonuclease HII